MRVTSAVVAVCVLSTAGCAVRVKQTQVQPQAQPKASTPVNPYEGFAAKARKLQTADKDKAKAETVDTMRAMAAALEALPHQPMTPAAAAARIRAQANKLDQTATSAPNEAAPARDAVTLAAEALAAYQGRRGPPDEFDLLDARNAAKAIDPKKKLSDQTNALAQAFAVVSDSVAEAAQSNQAQERVPVAGRAPSGEKNQPSQEERAAVPGGVVPLFRLVHELATEQRTAARGSARALLESIANEISALPNRDAQVERAVVAVRRAANGVGAPGTSALDAAARVRDGLIAADQVLQRYAKAPTQKALVASALGAAQSIKPRTPFDLQRAAIQDAFRATVDAIAFLQER